MKNDLKYALAISLSYGLSALLYIYLSSSIAMQFAGSMEELAFIESVKGFFFVIITSGILFSFSYYIFRRMHKQAQVQARNREALIVSERRALPGIFASSLAHDSSNILTSINLNLAQLNKQKNVMRPDVAKQVELLQEQVEKLSEIIRRMRSSSGKERVGELTPVNLSQVVQDSIDLASHHYSVKNCHVTFVNPPKELKAFVYPGLISQILSNLILNAAEAIQSKNQQGGKIYVHLKELPEEIKITVEDSGPGISEDLKAKIFQPFFTTKTNGTGLGLLSVKACVDQHGGQIDLKTSTLLGGAQFIISLPKK